MMRKTLRPAMTALALTCAALALSGCGEKNIVLGAACAPVDAATFSANPYKVRQNLRLMYAETTFGRALGNADCEDRNGGFMGFEKYAVCNFSGPAILEVELNGKHDYYTPGVGRPVAVTVRGGVAKCELPGQ
ncbi:MAG: hypothetical protein BGN86_07620 [Caulobacterales bacterium 68-7]|nr:hypothetical protein [Caulobacterales bacterium]OJU13071.1 MAG: hypothetical protein BGN86_07620 [Caulobacterales bacterium 68-7]